VPSASSSDTVRVCASDAVRLNRAANSQRAKNISSRKSGSAALTRVRGEDEKKELAGWERVGYGCVS
jgi:hypothetical protein